MIQLPLPPDVGARVLTQALLRLRLLGGPGSGNFGHGGRPGEVGGSGAGVLSGVHVIEQKNHHVRIESDQGFITLLRTDDPDPAYGGQQVFVGDIEVKSDLRKQGFGRALYEKALEYALSKGAPGLASSGALSDDAKRMWAKFAAEGRVTESFDGHRMLVPAVKTLGGPGSGNFGHGGRPGEIGGSALAERTVLHGTSQAALTSILHEGIRADRPSNYTLTKQGRVYVTTNIDEARRFATSAGFTSDTTPEAVIHNKILDPSDPSGFFLLGGTQVGGYLPAVLEIHLPPTAANKLHHDSNRDTTHYARTYKGNIRPEWIRKIHIQTRDLATDTTTWHTVDPKDYVEPKAAAQRDATVIFIPAILPGTATVTALGGPGSGNFGHSGRPGEVGGSGGALTDSTTHPANMTFERFSAPVPLPPVPAGHIRLSHVTSAENVPSILREGIRRGKSKGATYGEPTVVWATTHGETWGGSLDSKAREIIFDMPTSDVSSAGTLHRMGDVPPSAIVSVERAGFSDVSTGSLTLRQERQTADPDERRAYWDAYQHETPPRAPGIYDEQGRLIAPVQHPPHARPSGPWDMNRAAGGPGSGNFGHAGRPGEVGGSGEGARSGRMSKAAEKVIAAHEARIRREPMEHAVVVDDNGVVGYELTSNAPDYIQIDDAILPHLADKVFTHNHPQGFGLSLEDGQSAIRANLREIRAVGSDGTVHSLRRTGDTWPENLFPRLLASHALTTIEFRERIKSGTMTIAEANSIHHDTMYERVAAETPGVRFLKQERAYV